jgi:DNA-binding LacI/PurR family transcriptional regulator
MQVSMNRRATLADVAHAAKVSKTTASMALNGKGLNKIPPVTRERVLAAAQELHFRPHGVARALTRRCADVLGVVCTVNPFIEMAHHAFEQTLLSALFYHALERGYNPMVYGVPTGEAALPRYADGRSDAFILLYPPPDSMLLRYLHAQSIPVVALCCSYPESLARWVDSDHAQGIRAAVTHLAELGHRHIAYLVDPPADTETHTRVATFRATLQEHGLPVRPDWIVPCVRNDSSTEQQIAQLFAGEAKPTALLTWNDFAAEEVYQALRRRGFRIPEEVSIVGFDDTPSARAAVPPLTTVRQDMVRMGRAAVDLAIEALSQEAASEPPPSILCPVELVVRQSTAPPYSARHY